MILRSLLQSATHGTLIATGTREVFPAFASDSREISAGDLFVAVRGTHTDGHAYIVDAVQNGARGVLVEEAWVASASHIVDRLRTQDITVCTVPDVRLALQHYARAVLAAWQPQVIAIAGSAGKTTTKEMLATLLARTTSTFRSWRNYNDLLGVPLSLGHLTPDHRLAVIEIGCDWPGEIATLGAMLRPNLGIILNADETHLDGLIDRPTIARALGELIPSCHNILINRDDQDLVALSATYPAAHITQFSPARWLPYVVPQSQGHLALAVNDQTIPFPHLYGTHWLTSIAAATAAHQMLTNPAQVILSTADAPPAATVLSELAGVIPLPGRMRLLPGSGNAKLLDDTHNAIPVAMRAALYTLAQVGNQLGMPRVAILGDMLHLGGHTKTWHDDIGTIVPQCTDWLITRGAAAASIAQTAIDRGMAPDRVIITHAIEDTIHAAIAVRDAERCSPLVLMKGSPEMRMEQVTAALLAEPQRAHEVLDRQREVWRRAIVGEPNRPTWLEIDLGAIGQNCRLIKEFVGPQVGIIATLKADAYGHGSLKTAHTVLRNGADWLGVATLSETIPLRRAGITAPLLVYGYVPPWQAREAVQDDIRCTVYAADTAQALSQAAIGLGKTAPVHVKIDTGMGRLGLRVEDEDGITTFFTYLHSLAGISVEGIFTHFATADEADQGYAEMQLARFMRIVALLEKHGQCPPVVHAANSAAIFALPAAHFSMVRPGIALYGLNPSAEVTLPAGFRPAMTFKTRIAQVKTIPAGEGISYGATYRTTAPERIATLPVGYADGFRRGPANWGHVLIRGQFAPVRGRVCMDQTMVSVDHIPAAQAGDEVVLIGSQGDVSLTADDIARQLGTSNYEVIAALLARVPRISS